MAGVSGAARLVVFCGVPGVGKTTLSRGAADALGATYLRVDTIEVAIGRTVGPDGDSPVGYVVAEGVAGDQLRAGRAVVVDAVNATATARATWEHLAERCGTAARFVEVVCRDEAEHRRRVESRRADLPGHVVATWEQVTSVRFEPIAGPSLTVDTSGGHAALVDRIVRWTDEG